METGYEFEPRRLDRPVRRLPAVLLAVAVVIGLLIVKPWDGPPRTTDPVVVALVPTPTATASATPFPTAEPTPPWPAASGGGLLTSLPSWAAEVVGPLVRHRGSWGVGVGGTGPRLNRDTPWIGWTPATPQVTGDMASTVFTWPDTDLCAGLPTLDDRLTFIAVTTPRGSPPDWGLAGWWSDGTRVASIDDSLAQIPTTDGGGIKFFQRIDGGAWPEGRYEFHVIAGDQTVALTICLGHDE
jgi:hypothetical protein